ncbi:colanic acid biosynthesis acetyltransferase WcaF [Hydrogenophaga sp. D2P1]|uniref:Colanic acid biosynthesis acetyltransferase WcaF n=2 Tax=Hydrogenophaga aromaticivorans TaxID=2610898 RepID=A0A7Y8GSX2_9BURK|nr:putative colanic acid biosynthesis acetyltransferase [Hydrogenophaga aromaticivorans]NWF44270.1 colanic acid biosynthesis acetyltransferase WcaF [Hydrogenophaga aromaticivorans]
MERRVSEKPLYQDLSRFSIAEDFRGRSGLIVLAWQIVQATAFGLSPQPFYLWRRWLLRLFGAKVGKGAIIRPTARVTYPWKVELGEHCWIGDNTALYSLGEIKIGDHAVISQRCYICTGSHDIANITFPLTATPIVIEAEAWVATDCFVYPGVTIGRGAIIAARSTVLSDIPSGVIAAGCPATVRKERPLPHKGLPAESYS